MHLTIKDNLLTMLADADLISKIHLHVACGGSLVGYAKAAGVPYIQLRRFVMNDKEHEKIYQRALVERDEWVRESILDELKLIGLVDITAIFDSKGAVTDPESWPDAIKKNISVIEVKEEFDYVDGDRVFNGYTKRIKFHDKIKALDLLGKNQKLWSTVKESDESMKLEDILALAIKYEQTRSGS